MKAGTKSLITLGGIFLIVASIAFVFLDQMFSKPEIHKGVIVEKIKVEKNQVTPDVVHYRGSRAISGTMTISSADYPQWVAIVESDESEILRVHCSSEHFNQNQKGDTILFKKYAGHLLEVEYLSHNEEDTVQTDWDKVFKR
jgi:hypothetical protein